MRKPEEFYRFYYDKIMVGGVKPNAAHLKLAEMEAAGKLTAVVTQNIDGLHQAAGSKKVLELHGGVTRNYCMKCHKFFDGAWIMEQKEKNVPVPVCDDCGGTVKPDVVLYEEGLDQNILSESVEHISKADMLIVGGTSLVVYPAAGLIDYFHGKYLVLINKSATNRDSQADLVITDAIGEVLSEIRV